MAVIEVGTTGVVSAVLAFLFGLIILIWPKALNLTVAIYLLLVGILGILTYIL